MPVKIPVSYVPRAYVDYDAEARQILGQPLALSDGFRVPPLTPARLIALEIVSSQFFLHPDTCDTLDAAAALVLISCERELVEDLLSASDSEQAQTVSGAGTAAETSTREGSPSGQHGPSAAYPKLYAAAAAFLSAHGDAMSTDYQRLVSWICDVPFYGFAMRPGGKGSGKPFWFDGEFTGAVLAAASKLLATPVDTLLWATPLCTIGHAIAQQDSALGVKGVERPPDREVLRAMIAEAEAREEAGELHPWQYQDPLNYGLTDTQFRANPALASVFETMRAEYERNGHQPLDPAAFPIPGASEAERTAAVEASASSSGSAVVDPSGARDALPTITVQGLPCCPPGMRANNQDLSVYV